MHSLKRIAVTLVFKFRRFFKQNNNFTEFLSYFRKLSKFSEFPSRFHPEIHKSLIAFLAEKNDEKFKMKSLKRILVIKKRRF